MSAMSDDRLLSAWLHDTAPTREPEHLLGQVLARTARTRRRPAWRNPERFDLMSAISTRFAPASPVPWRLVAAVAALLLALAVGLVLVAGSKVHSPAPPYGLAGNGNVVFGSNGDILSVDSTGSNVAPLILGDSQDRVPILSLDGTQLSFLRGPDDGMELWVASADGSGARRVAGPWPGFSGGFDWSPQGDAIALTRVDDDDEAIVLVRADGSGTSTIHTGLSDVDYAVFRPAEGGQISFRATDAAGDFGYYLVNRDGSGLRHLALDPGFQDDALYDQNRSSYFNELVWTSNGAGIAYHTVEPDGNSGRSPGWRIHVADVDLAGAVSNERILRFDPAADAEFAPIVVPGSDDIIYRRLEGSEQRLMRGSTRTGSNTTDLGIGAPDWLGGALSPDGKFLMVAVPDGPAGPAQTKHVVRLDLATLSVTPLSMSDDFSWQRVGPPRS